MEGPANEEFRATIAPHGEPILTHISNFRPVKRVCDAVRMFAEVRQVRPAKLLLVGDGPERPAAEHLARSLGVDADVICLGKVKNPVEALKVSDVFVLPSESESFGLAALEAMAAGVPATGTGEAGRLPHHEWIPAPKVRQAAAAKSRWLQSWAAAGNFSTGASSERVCAEMRPQTESGAAGAGSWKTSASRLAWSSRTSSRRPASRPNCASN
jgi:hypothetical protein